MDDLEKVETIRTKCNVSYTDAKAALDAVDGNVLDAIIWLESQGKTQTTSAHAATESAPVDEPSAEMVAAQAAYEKSSEKTDFSKKMDSVWEYLKKLFRLSLDTKFIATRRDAIILNIPILIPNRRAVCLGRHDMADADWPVLWHALPHRQRRRRARQHQQPYESRRRCRG